MRFHLLRLSPMRIIALMRKWGIISRRTPLEKCLVLLLGLIIALLSMILVWYLLHEVPSCFGGCGPPVHDPGPYVLTFPSRLFKGTDKKLILFWTPKFGDPYWARDPSYTFDECEVKTCRLTANKDDLEKSDAIMFHDRDMWNNFMGIDLPPFRLIHQVWVYHNLEAPPSVYSDLKEYRNLFNWTATYRHDSDVHTPYGRLERINSSAIWETETDVHLKSCQDGVLGENMKKKICRPVRNLYRERTKSVAWTSSNCISQSRRQRIVNLLRRYIDVDTFGDCGRKKLQCPKGDFFCKEGLGAYRFYLAFENAVCKDYVSEKLWHALSRGQIPIVNGGEGYSQYLPINSYIDIRDFPTIKKLAEFIKKVNSSEELYNSYMWWREHYQINSEQHSIFFCSLCKKLHNFSQPAQVYTNLDGWFRNDSCQQFSINDVVSRFLEGQLLKYNIIS